MMVKEEDLNKEYILPLLGGTMKKITRRLLFATFGGALTILGVLSGYNAFAINTPFYGIPAVLFVGTGIFSLIKAFQ